LRFKLDLNDVFSLGWSCPIVSICALFFRWTIFTACQASFFAPINGSRKRALKEPFW
jgi:hypothetical protein